MKWVIALIAVGALGGCATTKQADEARLDAAVASNAATDTAGGGEAGEDGEPEMICKRLKVTGSNFRKRVCGTPEQWGYSEQQSEQAGIYLDKNRRAQSAFDN